MTAPVGRAARGRRLRSWPQWSGGLIAVAASLAALSLPATARAATTSSGYNQITGIGSTASALDNISWTQGVLDNTNSAIPSANQNRASACILAASASASPSASASVSPSSSPSSTCPAGETSNPLWFMDQQFQNLSVSVSQTQDIGHQGITVSWSGAPATVLSDGAQGNFLQMMECWGDATTGPNPEQCEYGASGLAATITSVNPLIGSRGGNLCSVNSPSTTSPPSSKDGSGPSAGCDPQEPSDPTHTAPCPGPSCNADNFYVPFSPVTNPATAGLDYDPTDTTYYSQFSSNEVQEATTSSGGTGQLQFETLTNTQAPGLGCGEAESDGSTRGCWLVIVPRGTYEPNGYQINTNSVSPTPVAYLDSSPLSATNWAMRIQIHLDYSPLGSFCPIGTLERPTFGTQLITRAMQSWELALNQQANCSRIYGFSAVFESQSTTNLEAGGDSGLAFTTIPIGSEAARDGDPPPANLPNIVYAPVAVAALDFGFDINLTGYDTKPVELTPLLMAKALTQSYKYDLPDYDPNLGEPGPPWAKNNSINISEDQEWETLNPGTTTPAAQPLAPLLTEDHTAQNQQIWQWIQSSSAATTWLGGTADASDRNMVVDPDYQALNIGQNPKFDSFPRAYTGEFSGCETVKSASSSPSPSSTCPPGQQIETKTSIDLLPYVNNYDSAAAAILTGTDPSTGEWNDLAIAPNGSQGWWQTNPPQPIGNRFIWAPVDTPDLAAYGLIPATLCHDAANDTTSNCVIPSTDSVGIAVSSATAGSSGLLEVNPASPGTGGWPLTDIIYAAVPTNQSAAALTDYANLISYSIGNGQTTGSAPGDLPPGYLPLPSNLVTQAQSVVTQLQHLATASPSPSTSTSSSTSPSSSTSSSTSSSATSATTSSGATAASTSTSAAAAGTTGGTTPAPTPGTTPNSAAAPTSSSGLGQTPAASGTHPATVPSGSTVPGGAIGHLPPAAAAAGSTPDVPVGDIRWALIAVAATGGGLAAGGTMLRSGMTLPWRRRRPGSGLPAPP